MLRRGPRRNHLVAVENQILRLSEGNRVPAQERQLSRRANLRQPGLDGRWIDRRRLFSAQTQQHGAIRSMPAPCQCQRTVELHPHFSDLRQKTRRLQLGRKSACGPHRAHGVGAGRPNPDLVEIEEARLHPVDSIPSSERNDRRAAFPNSDKSRQSRRASSLPEGRRRLIS